MFKKIPDGTKLISVGILRPSRRGQLKMCWLLTVSPWFWPALFRPIAGESMGSPRSTMPPSARNEVLPLCELIQDAINSAGLSRSLWGYFQENIGWSE